MTRRRGRQRAQGLVEFALFVPLFLLLLFTMLDFGFALYTNLTLEYASREGARVGSALAAGSTSLPCAQVDDHVIAAVQRVLQSAGFNVPLNNGGDPTKTGVNWIRIYKATNKPLGDGWAAGGGDLYNEWTYSATNATPPVGNGPNVDGENLVFVKGAEAWPTCGPPKRANGSTPDKIGVAISYTYTWQTPIASVLKLISPSNSFFVKLDFVDKTVMDLNPTFP